MDYLRFPTLAAARVHVDELGRSKAYTGGGDLPLPRCDCGGLCPGDHSGANVQRGANVRAECICTSRGTPDPACPFATMSPVDPVSVADGYAVRVTEAHARGEFDTKTATPLAADDEPRRLSAVET